MLVFVVNSIFSIAHWVLEVAGLVVLVYVVLKMVMPQNKYALLIGKYVEPVLKPIRALLQRTFPGLRGSVIDFSPLALFFAFNVMQWILRMLRHLLV